MIDLHSHSAASDGILPPDQAARYAAQKKLTVWALTDHDTVAGLPDAAKVCVETGVTFIPGCELNIEWPTGEFHLLGLGLRRCSKELESVIDDLTQDRNQRNEEIISKMSADGIEVSIEEIKSDFAFAQIGRPHFAAWIVKKGLAKNKQAAFDKYLGVGRPWYVPHHGADLSEACQAISSSGGIPVIAHPKSLYVSWGKMEDVLLQVKEAGVQGLEAYHPGIRPGEGIRLEKIARKLGFFVTAGSDFHGQGVRADRHLGRTCGDKEIEERFWLEELKPRLGDFDFKNTDWLTRPENQSE